MTKISELKRHRIPLPQAARLLRTEVGQVRKALERGPLTPAYVHIGNRRYRALDGIDLVYLRLSPPYSATVRTHIYRLLRDWPQSAPLRDTLTVATDQLMGTRHTIDIPLRQAVTDTLNGLSELQQLEGGIEMRDGVAVIRGTHVEAHRIAALVDGGMSTAEILRDYPSLTAKQVKAAIAYAKAHPKQGRPFPSRTVKSMLRQGKGGLRRAFAAARDNA